MAACGSHTAALRSTPAGVSCPEGSQVPLCALVMLNSGCSAGFVCQQKGTQRRGQGSPKSGTGAAVQFLTADGISSISAFPMSSVPRPERSGRHKSLVRASSAEPSQGSTGGAPQQQPGGVGGKDDGNQRDAARQALRALDQQLADLAKEPSPRPPRVGDAAWRAGSASDTSNKRPLIGPDSSPDDWPEFDATFFTYSSLILLVLTALVNWTFSLLDPKEDQLTPEVVAAKQEKRARMDALVQQVLGDGPQSRLTAPEVNVGAGGE